jgi:hypothetical protein
MTKGQTAIALARADKLLGTNNRKTRQQESTARTPAASTGENYR